MRSSSASSSQVERTTSRAGGWSARAASVRAKSHKAGIGAVDSIPRWGTGGVRVVFMVLRHRPWTGRAPAQAARDRFPVGLEADEHQFCVPADDLTSLVQPGEERPVFLIHRDLLDLTLEGMGAPSASRRWGRPVLSYDVVLIVGVLPLGVGCGW